MALPWAVVLAVVVLYCLARALVPGWQRAPHPGARHDRAMDLGHVVMGSAMVAMFLTSWSRPVSVGVLALFAAGLGWSLARAARPQARRAHAQLALGCAAMALMLAPAAAAQAAPARAGHPMSMGSQHAHAAAQAVPPTALLVPVLVLLVLVVVVRLSRSLRRTSTLTGRLDAGCDVAMAGAMASMLLAML